MGFFRGGDISRNEFERLSHRLEQLERTVARLALQQGTSYPANGDPAAAAPVAGLDLTEVMTLVQRGKKIEAIKRYRELTGAGLREAKEAVERF